jgi:RsiW-degrading membrane proteinase PrsW (M82 family)
MKNLNYNKVWLGIIAGIIVPVIAYGIYYLIVDKLELKRVNVSLCMAVNLVPFYLSLNREQYNMTKGVLIATLLWGAVIAYFSFFTHYFQIL